MKPLTIIDRVRTDVKLRVIAAVGDTWYYIIFDFGTGLITTEMAID